jgi:hypothetical protein
MNGKKLSNKELALLFCRVLEQVTLRIGRSSEFRLSGGRLLLVGRNEAIVDYIDLCDIEAVLREEMGRM